MSRVWPMLCVCITSGIMAPTAAQEAAGARDAIEQLFSQYELPAPEENAMPTYFEAFDLMDVDDTITGYLDTARYGGDPPLDALARNADALAKLDEALAMEGCISPQIKTFDALLPWFAQARQAARLMTCDGLVAEMHGDCLRAVDRYLDCVEIAQDMSRGSVLIGKLVETAITTQALRALRAAALAGDLRNEALLAAQDRLGALESAWTPADTTFAYEMYLSSLAAMDLVERAAEENVDGLVEGLDAASIASAGMNMEGLLAELYDFFSRHIDLSHEAYRDTVGLEPAVDDYRNPLTKVLIPALGRARTRILRSLLELRGTRTVIALARYRLAEGAYPDALDALAPAFVETVPIDPFSDEPPIYRQEPVLGEYVLYSIGEDVTDDFGGEADIVLAPAE